MPHRLNKIDAPAHITSALEVMKEASGAIPVPMLSPILSSILSIVQTVETIKGDKERCIRLAKRAFDLAERVQEALSAETGAIDHRLSDELAGIFTLLTRIQADLEKWSKEKTWVRILHRGTVSERLDEHVDSLDGAWRSFTALSLNALQRKLNAQAIYDPITQLRLFRWNDLRLNGRVRKEITVNMSNVQDEWEGEYNGNKVVVRMFAHEDGYKQFLTRLASEASRLWHPNVAQTFGYSHPDVPQRFTVLESGSIHPRQYLDNCDPISRWLRSIQLILRYMAVIVDTAAAGLVDKEHTTRNNCIRGNHCLSSLVLREDGSPVFSIEDFSRITFGCIHSYLRTVYNSQEMQPISTNAGVRMCTLAPKVIGSSALHWCISNRIDNSDLYADTYSKTINHDVDNILAAFTSYLRSGGLLMEA
ncbi:hypothetical protein OBBRIDRAFT_792170 [Obba rivulosa]|uniref:Mixed lineage kinase domain-containing protein n=1 Tax=Obba rivulosa TaxID=1052685 RepID=A0A8E2DLH8_9APHY|nr:hypothetical protein OBBRIDRAFT_792170 [Obba rivulosa]